ncbi:MAG: hypothetical protein RR150_05485 [Clostridia bacterium]
MAAWFRFKGVLSTDLGVYVTEYPPAMVPEERAEFKPVPGRSGELTLLEGECVYEDLILSIGCFVHDLSRLDEIAVWLRGAGDLILGNDEGKCYRARAVNQIELKTIVRARQARTFDAVLRCKPFKYEANPDRYRLTVPTTLTNEGTLPAAPKIIIQGTGSVTLTVGNRTVALDGLAGAVTIDCEVMSAYHTGDPESRVEITLADRDWPELPTGDTKISWTGDVRTVTVEPGWRWL